MSEMKSQWEPWIISSFRNMTDLAVSRSLTFGIKKPASKTIGGKIMTKNICGVKYLFMNLNFVNLFFII